jgi:hypothetical protein
MRLPLGSLRIQLGAGAVAAVAAVSSLGLAGVAYAEGGANLEISLPSTTVVQDAGKPFMMRLHNRGPETAKGIALIIDASGLDTSRVDFSLPGAGGCVPEGAKKVRCTLPDLPSGGNNNGLDQVFRDVFVQSINGTGAAGSVTMSVVAQTPDPDLTNNTATTNVTVVDSGIDMVAFAEDAYAKLENGKPITPGKTGEFLWMLFNWGKNAIRGVSYTITLPAYVEFASTDEPGCKYGPNEKGLNQAICTVDAVVDPGGSISFGDPQAGIFPTRVKLAPNAPGPAVLTEGVVSGSGLKELTEDQAAVHSLAQTPGYKVLSAPEAAKVRDDAKKAMVTPSLPDPDPVDNAAPFSVYTGDRLADLSVSVAPAQGHVDETVPVTVTAANAGPSDVLATKVDVTAPNGTEFTSVDAACAAVTPGKAYSCDLGPIPAGKTNSRVFQAKILSATVTDGKAVVSSAATDKKPDNNTAAIKVTVLTGAPGGGGSGGGSGLPITGAQVGLIGALGLGAIAIGAVLLVLTRRRREVLVPPTD